MSANFTIFDSSSKPDHSEKEEIVNFLHHNLGKYGDPKSHILKCLNYAIGEPKPATDGFVLILKDKKVIQGITIINKTGMVDYIPENLLVYIAVAENARGKGYGKKLMQKAIETAEGAIALHVDPDNPAKRLYEKLGFINKYLEMRFEP